MNRNCRFCSAHTVNADGICGKTSCRLRLRANRRRVRKALGLPRTAPLDPTDARVRGVV